MLKFLLILLIVFSSQTRAEMEGDVLIGVQAYFDGNYKTAINHLESAALKGNAESQYLLGHMFEHGEGVAVNQKESFKWYLAAAKQGIAPAQYNLSLNFTFGIGTTKDLSKGLLWLEKAARQGHEYAQYKLGLDLIEYAKNDTERKKGLIWLRIASLANVSDAQHAYAVLAPSISTPEHTSILLKANECIESSYTNCN